MVHLRVNGRDHQLDVPDDTPLLWVLRDTLHLTGTKYGCGIGQCGACTVHVGGEAQRACLLPVGQVHQDVLTIEGLPEAHPVKVAWVKAQVPQCGYCQSGQIMQAAALLEKMGKPTEAEIKAGMRGILCRCGTYPRILRAMLLASGQGAA